MRLPHDIHSDIEARRPPIPAVARAKRRAAGVDQAWAAAEIGVHRVTLARWEEGRSVPRSDNRRRWAQLLAILDEAAR